MKIHTADISETPEERRGSLPARLLELDAGSDVRAEEKITFKFWLQKEEETGKLLVTGRLGTKVKLCCGRCLEWIEWPLTVDDFVVEIEAPAPAVVDLTPRIREDILLALPFNAACRLDGEHRCPFSGKVYPPKTEPPASLWEGKAWQALDELKPPED